MHGHYNNDLGVASETVSVRKLICYATLRRTFSNLTFAGRQIERTTYSLLNSLSSGSTACFGGS
jgi:hypothetical protein